MVIGAETEPFISLISVCYSKCYLSEYVFPKFLDGEALLIRLPLKLLGYPLGGLSKPSEMWVCVFLVFTPLSMISKILFCVSLIMMMIFIVMFLLIAESLHSPFIVLTGIFRSLCLSQGLRRCVLALRSLSDWQQFDSITLTISLYLSVKIRIFLSFFCI